LTAKSAGRGRGKKMGELSETYGLPEEEAQLVREFIEFLRERTKRKKAEPKGKEEIVFATWPLGVKGGLTRREIYDHV
jgi:hypothetical protein